MKPKFTKQRLSMLNRNLYLAYKKFAQENELVLTSFLYANNWIGFEAKVSFMKAPNYPTLWKHFVRQIKKDTGYLMKPGSSIVLDNKTYLFTGQIQKLNFIDSSTNKLTKYLTYEVFTDSPYIHHPDIELKSGQFTTFFPYDVIKKLLKESLKESDKL